MKAATLERPDTQTDELTQPTALCQLAARIGNAVDSENQPITDAEASQVMDILVQQRILSDKYLNQVIQENLDDLRFKIA